MKRYSFLILTVAISVAVYVAPDFLFGENVAKAESITVVEDLAAGNDDTCNVGYLRYDIVPGGIRLCKKMTKNPICAPYGDGVMGYASMFQKNIDQLGGS